MEYLTPDEMARRLKCCRQTIYAMLRNGKIHALKFGHLWRIPETEIARIGGDRGAA